jgi:hypothetical protein
MQIPLNHSTPSLFLHAASNSSPAGTMASWRTKKGQLEMPVKVAQRGANGSFHTPEISFYRRAARREALRRAAFEPPGSGGCPDGGRAFSRVIFLLHLKLLVAIDGPSGNPVLEHPFTCSGSGAAW